MEVFKNIFGTSTGTFSLFSSSNAYRKKEEASVPQDQTGTQSKVTRKSPPVPEEKNPTKKTKKSNATEKINESPGKSKSRSLSDTNTQQSISLARHKDTVASANGVDAKVEIHKKQSKRACQEESEHNKPTKRRKIGVEEINHQSGPYGKEAQSASVNDKKIEVVTKNTSKAGKKRKKEDNIEARYEKRSRGIDTTSLTKSEPQMKEDECNSKEDDSDIDESDDQIKKRKRRDSDVEQADASNAETYDEEEKLKRTIFVGNLPLKIKKKAIVREFSQYGPIESVRLRSVPLVDTKIPRRGAIIRGQINEALNSQNAYVVFKDAAHATAARSHNMKEVNGNHIRVDAACAPNKFKPSHAYDRTRSIFVGNLPFDVKDEEIYQVFSKAGKSTDMDVEAIRVVRDPHTSLSKGIAYVLFKTQAGANNVLSQKRKFTLRERKLRISRVVSFEKSQNERKETKKAKQMDDGTIVQRKRAKLSASYEGVRATKDRTRPPKAFTRTQNEKGRHLSDNSSTGVKRKRAEKKQRGISRSKKIRRT